MTFQSKDEVLKTLDGLVEGDEVRALYAFPIIEGKVVGVEISVGFYRPYREGNSSFYIHESPVKRTSYPGLRDSSNSKQVLTDWVLNITKIKGREDIEKELGDACEEGGRRYLRSGK
ncbi:MAG: hypothetical protein AABW73_01200 [Nanoarchaeota archaeon]